MGFYDFDNSEFVVTPDLKEELLNELTSLFKDPLKKLKNLD